VLWIAALAGVAAATVLVVVSSHSGNRVRVAPLRDEKTGLKPRSRANGSAALDNGWVVSPAPRSTSSNRSPRRALTGGSGEPTDPGGRSAAVVTKHEGIHPVQSTNVRAPRTPTVQPPPIVIPVPGPASTSPSSAPPILSKSPNTTGGRPDDVTVSVRADELTIVQIEGNESSLTLLPGQEARITVEADVAAHLESKLTRRSGVLVLKLDD
jgi:hypothetical protein